MNMVSTQQPHAIPFAKEKNLQINQVHKIYNTFITLNINNILGGRGVNESSYYS